MYPQSSEAKLQSSVKLTYFRMFQNTKWFMCVLLTAVAFDCSTVNIIVTAPFYLRILNLCFPPTSLSVVSHAPGTPHVAELFLEHF